MMAVSTLLCRHQGQILAQAAQVQNLLMARTTTASHASAGNCRVGRRSGNNNINRRRFRSGGRRDAAVTDGSKMEGGGGSSGNGANGAGGSGGDNNNGQEIQFMSTNLDNLIGFRRDVTGHHSAMDAFMYQSILDKVNDWWSRPNSWPAVLLAHPFHGTVARPHTVGLIPSKLRPEYFLKETENKCLDPSQASHPYCFTVGAAKAVMQVLTEDLCIDPSKITLDEHYLHSFPDTPLKGDVPLSTIVELADIINRGGNEATIVMDAATRDPRSDSFLTFNQFCFRIRDCGDLGEEANKTKKVKRKVPVHMAHNSYGEFSPSFVFKFRMDTCQNAVMANLACGSQFRLPPQGRIDYTQAEQDPNNFQQETPFHGYVGLTVKLLCEAYSIPLDKLKGVKVKMYEHFSAGDDLVLRASMIQGGIYYFTIGKKGDHASGYNLVGNIHTYPMRRMRRPKFHVR